MLPKMRYVLAMMIAAGAASAQVRLPGLPLPSLPLPSVSQTLDQTAARSVDRLSALRRLSNERLLRANRTTLDADPAGEPVLRDEILVYSPTDTALDRARALGFTIDRERLIGGLQFRVVVLRAPPSMATKKALGQLRAIDPDGLYDYNHVYSSGGLLGRRGPALRSETAPGESSHRESSAAGSPMPAPTSVHPRVGLIDTGLDRSHTVFRDALIRTWGCGARTVPAPHGTAVASVLVGRSQTFQGALPVAELFAADVYCGEPTGGAVDALLAAFSWLVQEKVAVINVSLVGPKNALLERVIASLVAGGYTIVAAVGNDGPAAPPLYPASYPHVVGVTAVDAHRRVLLEAARGPQVMFSAFGADMKAASLDDGFSSVRGTSFAAPIVAALLAARIDSPSSQAAASALTQLSAAAIDLGTPGRDLTYGLGLVGADYPGVHP